MPPALHAQLNLAVNKRLTARCSLFSHMEDASMLTLIAELQPLVFVPGQVIVIEGHLLTAIYFINKGMVQLTNGEEHVVLRDHDNIGSDDFVAAALAGDGASAVNRKSAAAVTYCDMSSLPASRVIEEVCEAGWSFLILAGRSSEEGGRPSLRTSRDVWRGEPCTLTTRL